MRKAGVFMAMLLGLGLGTAAPGSDGHRAHGGPLDLYTGVVTPPKVGQLVRQGFFNAALQQIQRTYRQGSITEPQLESAFTSFLPGASCKTQLTEFFTQWWDTPSIRPAVERTGRSSRHRASTAAASNAERLADESRRQT